MAHAGDKFAVSGMVRDSAGAAVVEAVVSLLNAQQAIVASEITDTEGRFQFANVPAGSYLLVVNVSGFAEQREPVTVRQTDVENMEVIVTPRPVSELVTVTANPGTVESVETISQQVNVIAERELDERAKVVVAQVANEEPGLALQRTSPTISGITVRGLTGNRVNIFVDGIRFSTSAQRGGISTFLNLIDPTNLQAIEVLRGPNSAQYGSDAIGGSIQFLSRAPTFAPGGDNLHAQLGTFFNSADLSFGSNLSTSFSTARFGLLANLAGRRVNTLR
ncbi:MAG TPA: TonB-dependent receptor, partial [Blastocatellia bacterium]|nr:TonB-dependent receptor [Blastocatellia bacterium]